MQDRLKRLCEKHSGKTASLNWFQQTSWRPFIRLEYGNGERRAECRDCNVTMPKEMPRFYFYEAYTSWSGHYCLECGQKLLLHRLECLKDVHEELGRQIAEIESMVQLTRQITELEEYQKLKKCGVLLKTLGDR